MSPSSILAIKHGSSIFKPLIYSVSEAFSQHAGVINNQSKQINTLSQAWQRDNKKVLKLIALYADLTSCGVMDGKRKESLKAEINNLIDES